MTSDASGKRSLPLIAAALSTAGEVGMKIGEDEQCRTTGHGLHVASIERRTGERAMIGTPSTELHRLNVPIALGSDWPVAEFDPRLGMAWARLRRAPKTSPDHALEPHEVLDAYTALAGYTTVAAAIVADPRSAGQVAEGMRADLTGFASDPVTIPADELIDNPVMLACRRPNRSPRRLND